MYKHLYELEEATRKERLEKDKVQALEHIATYLEPGNWLETSIFGIRGALEDLVELLKEMRDETTENAND